MPNESIESPSLIQLVYVSAATVGFSSQDLDDLLENARVRKLIRGCDRRAVVSGRNIPAGSRRRTDCSAVALPRRSPRTRDMTMSCC